MVIKALEALENIKKLFFGSPIDLSHQFGIIEKELKALELIIKKNVNIKWIKIFSKFDSKYGLISYNSESRTDDKLTEDEFELLKEIIKW